MRIFVLGVGATGSLLAQLLARQGHQVSCGDKDPHRARGFLTDHPDLPLHRVNARNTRSILTAARHTQLIVNMLPAVCNELVLRAALRLHAHYLDTASHLRRNPFKPEQFLYERQFSERRRLALINAGAAPGLTNLLVAQSAAQLDTVDSVKIRLFESADSSDPLSQWSADVSFDEAVARPRIYRDGRYRLAARFGDPERFRFLAPIGLTRVMLAAQDEVGTLPHVIPMREIDVKIGGNEMDRLRRWARQGKLWKSRGLVAKRFPQTLAPRQVAQLIRRGSLHNARFAAAVVVQGTRSGQHKQIRWDATFPSLYQIRHMGLPATPIAWAAAHMAALVVKHFPRRAAGVLPPESLPATTREAILADARSSGIRITRRVTLLHS